MHIRHRACYAYVDAELADGTIEKLFRLRYAGSARRWGFAIYLYSNTGYEDSFLPSASFGGTPGSGPADTSNSWTWPGWLAALRLPSAQRDAAMSARMVA